MGDEINLDFEHAMEMEGLRYVAGYIAYKFPQHNLGTHAKPGENTWNEVTCRKVGALMTPTSDFFDKIKVMEKLFICHHGETLLKTGKDVVNLLSDDIANFVSLPKDVIVFFVRRRTFFRILMLNRNMNAKVRSVNYPK